jgi:hypothetical protein
VAANERNRDIWKQTTGRGFPMRVCWAIDIQRWKRALFAALG